MAACPFAGFGITHFGRRMTMLMLTAPFTGGWLLIYFAQNVAMIYAGRFFTGKSGDSPFFVFSLFNTMVRKLSMWNNIRCIWGEESLEQLIN